MKESSSRASGPSYSPNPAEAIPAADGSSNGRAVSMSPFSAVDGDEPPTVITQRTLPTADTRSESVMRILHGRILPGEHLGHFELLQYVGGGGMGKVFRARDTRLARSVALKILSPEHAADRETVLRFQNEAQSAARLDHDNIARVYYVGEDRGLHYIVFEFIEGVNVRDLVESKGPLSLAEAVSYTLQVADALAHAADRNVVHRDIKPSNLLITPAGQAKLIDMGLARLREVDAATADLTASGVTLGTFDYISPEQARDPRNTDVRSDIYSLGCTLFFMLTGRPPFLGGTMLQKLLQHQADQPPDLGQFRPDLPEDVNRVLRKMLAKDPRRRYSSPQELVNDLLAVARAAGLRPTAPGGRTWLVPVALGVPAYYRHLPWIVSLFSLVAIVFALDYLWAYLPGPASPSPKPEVIQPDDSTPPAPLAIPAGSNVSAAAGSSVPAATKPGDSSAAGHIPILPTPPLPTMPLSTMPLSTMPLSTPSVPTPPLEPLQGGPILPNTPSPKGSDGPAEAPSAALSPNLRGPASPVRSGPPSLDAPWNSGGDESIFPPLRPWGDDLPRGIPKDSGDRTGPSR
jgi:serine/threonine-protein kinase